MIRQVQPFQGSRSAAGSSLSFAPERSSPPTPPARLACIQDKITEVNKVAVVTKARMEALDKLNEAAKKQKGQGAGTASERTRTTVTAGLKKKLKDHMQVRRPAQGPGQQAHSSTVLWVKAPEVRCSVLQPALARLGLCTARHWSHSTTGYQQHNGVMLKATWLGC
jgi:hypothetical protein